MGVRLLGPVDDDLGDPVAVAEVEEDQLAVVAAAMDPARQAGGRPGVGGPQRAAGVGPVGRGEAVGGRVGRAPVGRGESVMAGVSYGTGERDERLRPSPSVAPRTAQARATRWIVPSGAAGSDRRRRSRSRGAASRRAATA